MTEYTFDIRATLSMVKHENCTLADTELATAVFAELKERLGPPNTALGFSFVTKAMRASLIGPEGGIPIQTE